MSVLLREFFDYVEVWSASVLLQYNTSMVNIKVLNLTEDPIRYIAEQTCEDPVSYCVVFPTARNIRHFHRTLSGILGKKTVVVPRCYEINGFIKHCLDPAGVSLVPNDLRPFYLQCAIRMIEQDRLDELFQGNAGEMQDDFIRFASTGMRILKFFDEVYAEKIPAQVLKKASLYTDYETHIGVLEEIIVAYKEVLSASGFIDPMFLKKEGKIRPDLIERFEKVYFLVSGYLTRFETDMIRRLGEKTHVEIILRYEGGPDFQTKKIFNACGIEQARAQGAGMPSAIEISAYEEAAGQFGFIIHAVDQALRSGIALEDIVVVLPDENMKRIMFGLDKKRIFNYAMGLDMKDTVWYSLLKSIEALFRDRIDHVHYRSKSVITLLKHPFIRNLSPEEEWIDTFISQIKYSNSLILKEGDFCMTGTFQNLFSKIKDLVTKEQGYSEFLKGVSGLLDDISKWLDEGFLRTITRSPEFNESRIALVNYIFQAALLPYDRAGIGTDSMRHLSHFLGQLAGLTYNDVAGGGVTVMGMLETRNIHFRAVIIPDMNEEMIPPRSEKDMFLNTNIRQALGIPDFQDREHLAKYYFNALIKNAQMVFLCYVERDDRPIRSRLIEEILIETGHAGADPAWLRDRRQYEYLLFDTQPVEADLLLPNLIKKDRAVHLRVDEMIFTAYKLRIYRQCSYKFYLLHIIGLDESREIEDKLGAIDVGNILHEALKQVYQAGKVYGDAGKLSEEIRAAVKEESSRYDVLQLSPHAQFEIDVLIDKLFRFAEHDVQRFREGWRPRHIEKDLSMTLGGVRLSGRIDRVDVREGDGSAFIIDYKYSDVGRLKHLRYDRAFSEFQLPLYRMILKEAYPELHVEGLGYYDLRDSFSLVTVIEHGSPEDFEKVINDVIEEIRSFEKDFVKTDNLSVCRSCGFARICGRQR